MAVRSFSALFISIALLVSACGGGGGGSNNPAVTPPPTGGTGNLTVLVGDGPLDSVFAVNIVISDIILIGEDDGQETVFSGEIGPINLLDLRNITELLFDGEVPAGDYSKIRLRITSLEVVETEGMPGEDVQLPANGRIDLNPQGTFNIAPGEDLVIQIDFDLDRSIHVVQTGNSRYRFRPVVFVDIIDQTDQLRLSKIFGLVIADGDDQYEFCYTPEMGDEMCTTVVLDDPVTILDEAGMATSMEMLVGGSAHAWGHFFVPATGEGTLFRAKLVVQGDEDSIEQIEGGVEGGVVDSAFPLLVVEGEDPFQVGISTALVLDELGDAFTDEIAAGQEAEAWAQVSVLTDLEDPLEFPAFLVQISPDDEEDSVEGTLFAVEGDQITLTTEAGEACVLNVVDTEIQQISGTGEAAESMDITVAQLGELVGTAPTVEAFGETDGDCLVADVIVVETDG